MGPGRGRGDPQLDVVYDLLEGELNAVHLAHPLKVRAIAAHLRRYDLLPTAHVRPKEERLVQQVLRQRMLVQPGSKPRKEGSQNAQILGEPSGTRTRDPLIKSQVLFRLS
jgi:hypothetical protein